MQNKNKLALMATSFIISALAVTAGTFAWFEVLDLTGATVSGSLRGEGDTLQMGFRVSEILTEEERHRYNFTPDTHNIPGDGYVYWTDTEIEPETFDFLYAREGYSADHTVLPLTSGSFQEGDDLALYEHAFSSGGGSERLRPIAIIASRSSYVGFSLLFRMAHVTQENPDDYSQGVAGYHIYFDYGMRFIGSKNVTQALRMGIITDEYSDIVAPASKHAGTIAVGGRMDFDGNGYYDLTTNKNPAGKYYEIAYGEFENELAEDNWGTPSGVYVDPNKENDFFYDAQSFMWSSPLINAVPKTARYNPISKYNPLGIPLATTNDLGVAEINFNIWLEGWDHACTNQIVAASFGADLKFVAQQ